MTEPNDVNLVVVGSIGLDTVKTPAATRKEILGGSVSYACAAASFFCRTGMVGVAGTDFPDSNIALYESFGIDLEGLQRADGKTFRWSGVYEEDMNTRKTLSTDLNVFSSFLPQLPDSYRKSPFFFLANISPELQLHVLSQAEHPLFVAVDTMDLWIQTASEPLAQLIQSVQMLLVNDSEARQLTGETSLLKAAELILDWGPSFVVIKKGEYGSMLASRSGIFMIPSYPVANVVDPTGAGDTFAGGFMGVLAEQGCVHDDAVRRAMGYGATVASFGVESFSLDRLSQLSREAIDERFTEFRRMLDFRMDEG